MKNHEANIRGREKPFTSSLSICREACDVERGGGGRSNAFPLTLTLFPIQSMNILFKDDVTVIPPFGVSVAGGYKEMSSILADQ
jgi:hypothetical protein